MKIHLIAIGGAVMHNLALDLHKDHIVTGSDDEIYNPSRSRLEKAGILPKEMGWFPQKINKELDIVILGMHAKIDNPELLKAQELGLTIYSYPEYIHFHSRYKRRIVVAGSHGKTTTTSMIMHVLNKLNRDFDYLVGAQIEGFNRMVKLSDAPIIIIEGDEYLSSPLDRTPKMLHYDPDVSIITGIAWDHINVFPTFDNYKSQFALFLQGLKSSAKVYYYDHDQNLKDILKEGEHECSVEGYELLPNQSSVVSHKGKDYDMSVFGNHNFENMHAALKVCSDLGVTTGDFLSAMQDFKGAGKRLQILKKGSRCIAYLDFAHAPSKVKATTLATRSKYSDRKVYAFLELHTFSSLDPQFIPHYKDALNAADEAFVFFDPHTLKMKNMDALDNTVVASAFNHPNLKILNSALEILQSIEPLQAENAVFLFMSSGKFGGIDLIEIMNKKIVE